MELVRVVTVFDAADVSAESHFWASILGGWVVDDDPDFHCVFADDGAWRVGVQFAADHIAPEWRGEGQQQQIHLDLHVDNPLLAHDEAIKFGARLLQSAPTFESLEGHQVYADPAGHPFCIGWGHPSRRALAEFVVQRSQAMNTRFSTTTAEWGDNAL